MYIRFFNVNNLQVCVLTFFSQKTENKLPRGMSPRFERLFYLYAYRGNPKLNFRGIQVLVGNKWHHQFEENWIQGLISRYGQNLEKSARCSAAPRAQLLWRPAMTALMKTSLHQRDKGKEKVLETERWIYVVPPVAHPVNTRQRS